MASHIGIRASGSGTGEYVKRIVLKDATSYGPWRAKLTSILDAEECWEIVNGTELEPDEIVIVEDDTDEELPDNIHELGCARQEPSFYVGSTGSRLQHYYPCSEVYCTEKFPKLQYWRG